MKESTRVLLALVLAIGLGAAISASGIPSLIAAADLVAPVGTLWINAIRMTVIPLVMSLLVTAVASAAEAKSVGRLTARTVTVFAFLLALVAVVTMLVLPLAFRLGLPSNTSRPPLPPGAADAAAQLATAGQAATPASWIVGLVPTNPIAAAASGAMLPLFVFTLLLGLAIARSSDAKRGVLLGFFSALAEAMLIIVRWVIALAPIGVFALVLPLAVHSAATLAGGIGFYVVVYSLGCLLAVALHYPVAVLLGKVPLRRFARAALKPQTIAFSSSSSMASLPALVESAERELGLPQRVTGFVLPVAISTFHVVAPVTFTAGALFVAWFYGIPLSAGQIAFIALASGPLTVVGPGVPRGGFLVIAPLFEILGLPLEGIGILIAIDAIPDVFATVANVTGDFTAAVLVGRREGASV